MELAQALRGSWCATDDGGKTCWGYDTFSEDGTVRACGTVPETGKHFFAKASFAITGNKACFQVTESDDPRTYAIGSKFCTEVLAIGAESQRYRHLDTGKAFTTYRVPAASVRCAGDA
jgi:hypothetical protein